MALSAIVKKEINGILMKYSIDEINLYNLQIQNKSGYSFLELVYYLIDLYDEKLKTSGSAKRVAKIIRCINLILYEFKDEEMPLQVYDSLNLIESKYNEYIENNSGNDNIKVREEIGSLSKLLSESKVQKETDDKQETNKEIVKEIVDDSTNLSDERKKKDELKKLTTKLKRLQTRYDKLKQKSDEQSGIIVDLNKQLELLENEMTECNKKIQDRDNAINNITNNNDYLKKNNYSLEQDIDELSKLNNQLKKEIKKEQLMAIKFEEMTNQLDRNKKIDDGLLILMLKTNNSTVKDFKDGLEFIVGQVTDEEISESIKRLKSKYCISQNLGIEGESLYKFSYPTYKQNDFIKINCNDSIDILAISDLHLNSCLDKELESINNIYEYASKNGIKTIINLGDMFDFVSYTEKRQYKSFENNECMIENVIKRFPFDKNINHLIMGGNHDKLMIGLDPIKELCIERQDFIDLGYDHAGILFGEDIISLHHIAFRSEDHSKNKYDNKRLLKLLRDYYSSKEVDNKKVYLDLLGHVHKSSLSVLDGYATVPSLNLDRVCNGAWHLNINFDKSKHISYILFKPLKVTPKVEFSTEIVYTKKK